jgi:hypothetical protein
LKTINFDNINTIKDLEIFIDQNINLGLLSDIKQWGMILWKLEEVRRNTYSVARILTIIGFLLGCGFTYFLTHAI